MLDRQNSDMPAAQAGSSMPLRVFAALMGVLILVQAFLGGRGFFLSPNLLKMHQTIGIVTFIVALIQVGIVLTTLKSGRTRSMLLGMSAFIFVLTTIQLGLGFSAKNGSGESAAWHIFTGVFLTGAIAAYANTVFRSNEMSG